MRAGVLMPANIGTGKPPGNSNRYPPAYTFRSRYAPVRTATHRRRNESESNVRIYVDMRNFAPGPGTQVRYFGVENGRKSSNANHSLPNCANLGKLLECETVALDVVGQLRSQGFEEVAIGVSDAERAGRLPGPHPDPFDRLPAVQALAHEFPFNSADPVFERYDVVRLW